MGGFYIEIESKNCDWLQWVASLPEDQAFAEPLPLRLKNTVFDINIHEIEVVLQSFQRWGVLWAGAVYIHTDNTTAQFGVLKQTLKSPAHNEPLRQLLLIAAELDIKVEAIRISSGDNGLADALSRNEVDKIADWCPHWQMIPTTMPPTTPPN